MAITHKWSGDGLPAAALTNVMAGVGDTAFDVVSGTVNVVAAGLRSPRIEIPAITNYVRWIFGSARSVAAYRFYFTTPATSASATTAIMRLRSATSNVFAFSLSGVDTFRVIQSGGGQVGASIGITMNTTYRIEIIVNHGNGTTTGTSTVRIYTAGGALLDTITVTGAAFGTSHDQVQFGTESGGTTMDMVSYDDIAASDTEAFIGDVATTSLMTRIDALITAVGADIKTINAALANRKRMTYDLPTGYVASTLAAPRGSHLVNNLGILTTQREYLQQIFLEAGTVVTNLSFFSGGTAAGTPTNYWFTLRDINRVLLARSNDQLTAAWAINSEKKLAMQTPYTVTTSGLYYAGLMVKATTVPNLVGNNRVATIDQLAPIVQGQTADTGLTTTPPSTAGVITASTGMALCMAS